MLYFTDVHSFKHNQVKHRLDSNYLQNLMILDFANILIMSLVMNAEVFVLDMHRPESTVVQIKSCVHLS